MAEVEPDIKIQVVSDTGIVLPSVRLKMVFVHPPFDANYFSPAQPFRWSGPHAQSQLTRVRQAMAKAHAHRAHFTVFPEYGLPGLDGVSEVETWIKKREWPSVVVAGVDGLTKEDYAKLCAQPDTTVAGGGTCQRAFNCWYNVCLTWLKTNAGVRKWVQPKIRPNALERINAPTPMFEGESVILFECHLDDPAKSAFNFASFICSDWFAKLDDGKRISDHALERLNSDLGATNQPGHLNLVLVPQCNSGTGDAEALESARNLLEGGNRLPFIQRADCLVAFVNFAGAPTPGTCASFGRSCVIAGPGNPFSWSKSPDTVAVETKDLMLGNHAALGQCKNALFREFGTCIHVFELLLPQLRRSNQTRSLMIDPAEVHSCSPGSEDKRTPDAPVPAVAKWVLDRLDGLPTFSRKHAGHVLAKDFETAESRLRESVKAKTLDKHRACPYVLSPETSREHVDAWGDREKTILDRTLTALAAIGARRPVDAAQADTHASADLGGRMRPILVVAGDHHGTCLEHAKELGTPGLGNVKTILITDDMQGELRDYHGRRVGDEAYRECDEVQCDQPNTWFYWRGLANILNRTTSARNRAAYTRRLKGALNVQGWRTRTTTP